MTSTEDIPAEAPTEPTAEELEAKAVEEFSEMEGETIDDNKKEDAKPSEPEEKPTGEEKPSDPNEPKKEGSEPEKQTGAQRRWAKVLGQRTEAREEAKASSERVKELEKELEESKKEKKVEEPATPPKAPSNIRDAVRQEMAEERKAALESQARLDALHEDEPLAEKYSKQIREARERYPEMSELAAWTLVKGVHGITSEQAKRNPNEAGVGGNLSPSHTAPINPEDMSTDELEKAVKDMDKSEIAKI